MIVGTAFEIMLDVANVGGDKALGMGILSTRLGVKAVAYTSVVLYSVIMVMDPLPLLVPIDPRLYIDCLFFLFILVPVVSYLLVSRSLVKDQSKENIFALKKRVYLTMQTGCVAYLVGALLLGMQRLHRRLRHRGGRLIYNGVIDHLGREGRRITLNPQRKNFSTLSLIVHVR